MPCVDEVQDTPNAKSLSELLTPRNYVRAGLSVSNRSSLLFSAAFSCGSPHLKVQVAASVP